MGELRGQTFIFDGISISPAFRLTLGSRGRQIKEDVLMARSVCIRVRSM